MKKKRQNKKTVKDCDGATLLELEKQGLIPENIHLSDSINMKEGTFKNTSKENKDI